MRGSLGSMNRSDRTRPEPCCTASQSRPRSAPTGLHRLFCDARRAARLARLAVVSTSLRPRRTQPLPALTRQGPSRNTYAHRFPGSGQRTSGPWLSGRRCERRHGTSYNALPRYLLPHRLNRPRGRGRIPRYRNTTWEFLASHCPCILNVRPLAVLRSFSSFSGRALRRTRRCQQAVAPPSPPCRVYRTLKEIGSSPSHARVNVRLGRLDMVVEVVPERLDVGDDIGHALLCEVSREEN